MSTNEAQGRALNDEKESVVEQSPTEKLQGEQEPGQQIPGAQNPESKEIKKETNPNTE